MAKKLRLPQKTVVPTKWPYLHVIVDPDTVQRVKRLAIIRGYALGELVDILLRYALDNLEK